MYIISIRIHSKPKNFPHLRFDFNWSACVFIIILYMLHNCKNKVKTIWCFRVFIFDVRVCDQWELNRLFNLLIGNFFIIYYIYANLYACYVLRCYILITYNCCVRNHCLVSVVFLGRDQWEVRLWFRCSWRIFFKF